MADPLVEKFQIVGMRYGDYSNIYKQMTLDHLDREFRSKSRNGENIYMFNDPFNEADKTAVVLRGSRGTFGFLAKNCAGYGSTENIRSIMAACDEVKLVIKEFTQSAADKGIESVKFTGVVAIDHFAFDPKLIKIKVPISLNTRTPFDSYINNASTPPEIRERFSRIINSDSSFDWDLNPLSDEDW